MRRWWIMCAIAAVGAACIGDPPVLGGDTDETDARDTDSGDVVDTSAGDAATVWGVQGTLAVTAGAVDLGATSLQLATRGVACVLRADIDKVVPIAITTAAAGTLLHLWRLDVTPDEAEAGCAWRGPVDLLLGIGPQDLSLGPSAARAGYPAERAYSLQLATLDDWPPTLAGIAFTDALISGSEPPVQTRPVADGAYTLVTLHGLPVRER